MRDSEHPQRCSVNRYAVLHFVIESAVDGFASLRKKLGLTAHEMAHLIGVSAQSVYHWEAGKSRPRASQLSAISEVRKLSKKEAWEKLAG
jgi:DNA-binding XRE family transcriptional regulator